MLAGVLPDWVSDVSDGSNLLVRVTPRAGRNALAPERSGRLQVRVTAAPEDGKANAAACKLIAKALHTAKSNVTVASGAAHREKTIHVAGIGAAEVADALAS